MAACLMRHSEEAFWLLLWFLITEADEAICLNRQGEAKNGGAFGYGLPVLTDCLSAVALAKEGCTSLAMTARFSASGIVKGLHIF
jgi:hypothetical protein